jgi:hypothetical protein
MCKTSAKKKGENMQDKRGLKRRCPKCGAFFYDMGKKKFTCPKCQEAYNENSYQTAKEKSLDKILKKESTHLNADEIDTETLLQMTNAISQEPDDDAKDDMMDMEEVDSNDIGELNDYLDDYPNEDKGF